MLKLLYFSTEMIESTPQTRSNEKPPKLGSRFLSNPLVKSSLLALTLSLSACSSSGSRGGGEQTIQDGDITEMLFYPTRSSMKCEPVVAGNVIGCVNKWKTVPERYVIRIEKCEPIDTKENCKRAEYTVTPETYDQYNVGQYISFK